MPALLCPRRYRLLAEHLTVQAETAVAKETGEGLVARSLQSNTCHYVRLPDASANRQRLMPMPCHSLCPPPSTAYTSHQASESRSSPCLYHSTLLLPLPLHLQIACLLRCHWLRSQRDPCWRRGCHRRRRLMLKGGERHSVIEPRTAARLSEGRGGSEVSQSSLPFHALYLSAPLTIFTPARNDPHLPQSHLFFNAIVILGLAVLQLRTRIIDLAIDALRLPA